MDSNTVELIVDATIIFIALTGKGITKNILFSKSVRLYAPKLLFDEIEDHKSRIKILSRLSSEELENLLELLKSKVIEVPYQKNNGPPHPKGCGLVQALVFRIQSNPTP